jgi:large subunit ribosomal protein L13
MSTYSAKPGENEPRWFIVDVAGKALGRTATEVARILQGKNKPQFTPHVDTGDYVVIVNASKVKLTGKKLDKKMYHHHSGWMGNLTSTSARELLDRKPDELVRKAVRGMLPKTTLGRAMLRKLKIHAGACPSHGYVAQKAEQLKI